jgi:hypothetical protein
MKTRRLAHPVVLFLAVAAFQGSVEAQRGAPPTQPAPRDPRAPGSPAVPGSTTAAAGTAVITGSVVVSGTGQPARRARVNLSASEGGVNRTVTTDERGQFSIAKLPAGRYSLSASKPGHLGASYGQVRPGRPGTPIQLADGQRFDVQLQIFKGSVITGTILDENGEAIPGTPVRVMRYVMQNGVRTLQQAGNGNTDDRGIYRIYGLQPGDYLVGATPRNTGAQSDLERMQSELQSVQAQAGRAAQLDEAVVRELTMRASMLRQQLSEMPDEAATGYAPVYYPGTTAPGEAATVSVAPAEEKIGIDFQMQRVPVGRIEGLVVNGTGQALQNMQVMLASRSGVPGADTNNVRADSEGRFRIQGVAPGQYLLSVRATANQAAAEAAARGMPMPPPSPAQGRGVMPARPDAMRYWAAADIVVDGRNMSNVVLTLQPGMTLTGRVQFDGSLAVPTDLSRVRVNLNPVSTPGIPEVAQPAPGRVDASGKFTIVGVVPGRYRLSGSGGGQGWVLESAVVEGQDTLDFPVDIRPNQTLTNAVVTFGDHQADISGLVLNERAQPAPEYTVVLYPADERYWTPGSRRIRTSRPATDGKFQFAGLAPGDYRLAPIFDAEPGSWYDPGFLRQLDAVAVSVAVGEREKKVQNLKVR